MAKRKTKFLSQDCGYETAKWMGKCPGCGNWNTMVEEVEKSAVQRKGAFAHSATSTIAAKPIPMLASRIRSYCNSLPCASSIPTIAVNIMSKFTLGFVSETNSQTTTGSLDCDDDDVVEFSMT